jgi:hypothetical protein
MLQAAASAMNWSQIRMIEIRHSGRISRSAMNEIMATVRDEHSDPEDLGTSRIARLDWNGNLEKPSVEEKFLGMTFTSLKMANKT